MHTLSGFVNRLNLLRHAAWRAGHAVPRSGRALRRQASEPAVLLDQPEPSTACCGWFDSSHALHNGLCVTEHTSPDTLAQALPLDTWLALHLAGRIPAAAAHAD